MREFKTVQIGDKAYPVHFGINAKIKISKALNIDFGDFVSGISIKSLGDQIEIARIGLVEGCRLANPKEPIPAELLVPERFADLLDQSPEALDDILSVYFVQTFGKSVDKFFAELEKENNPEANTAAEPLKKVWTGIEEKVAALDSVESTK